MCARILILFLVLIIWPNNSTRVQGQETRKGDPESPKNIYVVPFSHLDLWYLGPPHNSYARFERILSGALAQIARDPEYRFTIENAYYLHQYLGLRPEAREPLSAALANGRLDLSAQWSSIIQNAATGEDLVRNLLLASSFAKSQLNFRPRAVIAADMPGFTPQISQLWSSSGIKGAMLTRGGPANTPIFDWEAPDGSTTRVAYTIGGYASGWMVGLSDSIETAEGKKPFVSYHSVQRKNVEFSTGVKNFIEKNYPGPGPAILGAGPDLSFPPRMMTHVVDEWNRRYGRQATIDIVTLPEFFGAIEAHRFPNLKGDLQSVWQPAALSVERHATLARNSHLLSVAEKLATLTSLLTPMVYPSEPLQDAWERHLITLDHEGASLHEFPERVRQIAGEIQQRSAQMIASRIPTKDSNAMVLAVVNPLSWSRHALIQVPLYLHGDIPSDATRWKQIVVRDENGNVIPARLRETSPHAVSKTAELSLVLELPALGYRSVVLEPAGEADKVVSEAALWESPTWRDLDVAKGATILRDGWEARYDPALRSVLLALSGKPIAQIDLADLTAAGAKALESEQSSSNEMAVTWKVARQQESWSESILHLEGGGPTGSLLSYSMDVKLRAASAPEVASRVTWPRGVKRRIVQRVRPIDWSLSSLNYGVPFGEIRFGSKVPGSGPTNLGDERPPELWRKLKEFDGWVSWKTGSGLAGLATEARGALFTDTAIMFLMSPKVGVLPSDCEEVSLLHRFDYTQNEQADQGPNRLMWEMMEEPVFAVAEDRFGATPLPAQYSLLNWEAPGLIVTGLRRDLEGNLILRTYAHSDQPTRSKLITGLHMNAIEKVSPIEEAIEQTTVDQRFKPWEIQTLRLRVKPLPQKVASRHKQ